MSNNIKSDDIKINSPINEDAGDEFNLDDIDDLFTIKKSVHEDKKNKDDFKINSKAQNSEKLKVNDFNMDDDFKLNDDFEIKKEVKKSENKGTFKTSGKIEFKKKPTNDIKSITKDGELSFDNFLAKHGSEKKSIANDGEALYLTKGATKKQNFEIDDNLLNSSAVSSSLASKDVLVYKKTNFETKIISSILKPFVSSLTQCNSLQQLEDELLHTHYSVFLFDYDIENIDLDKISKWLDMSEKHVKGRTKVIMYANNSESITRTQMSMFDKIIDKVINKRELERLIKNYLKKS